MTRRRGPVGKDLTREIEAKGINLFECYTCRLCTEEMNRGILTLTEPYRQAFGETEWRRDIFNEPVCPTWDYYRHEAYTAYGRALMARDLGDGLEVDPRDPRMREVVYTCLLCTGCQELCFSRNRVPLMKHDMQLPREVWDLHGILLAKRKWLFDKFGWDVVPAGLRALAQRLIRTGTSTGEPGRAATRWVKATRSGTVDLSRDGRADVLLLLDGTAPYDRGTWPALAAAVRLLLASGLTVGTLGADEIATSLPVLAAGDVQSYLRINREAIRRVATVVRRAGVKQVVTVDDTGFAAWTAPAKHYGVAEEVSFPFAHLIPFLHTLLEDGRLRLTRPVDKEVALLDSCHLGRYCKVLDAPRAILARVPGLRVREAHLRREYLYCCGAAAGVPDAYPEQADWWGRKRLGQAAEVLAQGRTVVTTSPICGAHLRRTAAAEGTGIEVKDLAEVAALALA
ncbi:MAG TPA: (Fe-S)-binding protein [bacterium]|nr:(Fe-S)-binding protein [bacterium]